MSKTPKKITLLILSLLLTLAIAWFASFEFAKTRILQDFEKELTHLKTQGYEISYDGISMSGSPLLVSAHISNLKIKTPQNWGGGQTPLLTLSLRPWSLNHFYLDFEGDTHFDIPPFLNTTLLKLVCQNCKSEIWIENQNWNQIQISAHQIAFQNGEKTIPLTLSEINLDLENNIIDHRIHLDFSSQLQGLDTALNLKGYTKSATFLFKSEISHFQTPYPKTLAAWRDQGGIIDIKKLSFTWAPLDIQGDGTFTFDEQMRPLSAFSATISGYDRALEVLTEVGVIKKKAAQMAGFILGMLAHQNQKGEKEITVPITTQNGKLSVGPADLIELEPIRP
ncbi:DUF2125 domain-containing protein [Candidatus Bealeia paramacronuclearis]|uniref:DUF2125 domain-containing protein n=1 Tax=Candidatus Bealeia paramacronuclearis TaxID=1921001 RepID=A0ABZ2C2T8_9PROT|nr:hypothetical protein [Candidatus Bealeia paramacronuclearis]